MNHRTFFRTAAVVEAVTWLGLLGGMIMKYGPPDNEIGVEVFGPLHGIAFIVYLIAVATVFRRFRWSWGTTTLAVAAAVPPVCTVVFDTWASRTGRLGTGSTPVPSGM
ncbi:DUF3817 domain-containing protein [Phytoactinopolyspora alkaliphila]|uniref:DUF3817 domain-containing protein n=1 Tax=Phytoactinopolyspora alkaliphila TaxID=1783498 RepID=A0A6N9YM71_9ACTN|nr:DUF3817 domain-containing protein [Phytoactinopolyspora alkaliphila]NED96020.1 DUF3817 domain-containing protein [Phytoactinopolyspora alkaliphila]